MSETATRIKVKDAVGVTLQINENTVGGVISISGGGFTREMLDDTDLSNANWMTKVGASLRSMEDVTVEAKISASGFVDENCRISLTAPGVTLSFWGQVSNSGSLNLAVNTGITKSITITPTNLDDSGNESAPTVTYS